MAERHWSDERDMKDAPIFFDSSHASAWASGWNAAVEEFTKQLNEAHKRETGR